MVLQSIVLSCRQKLPSNTENNKKKTLSIHFSFSVEILLNIELGNSHLWFIFSLSESLVQKLQHIVCDASNPAKVIQQGFKYLYLITKVCFQLIMHLDTILTQRSVCPPMLLELYMIRSETSRTCITHTTHNSSIRCDEWPICMNNSADETPSPHPPPSSETFPLYSSLIYSSAW